MSQLYDIIIKTDNQLKVFQTNKTLESISHDNSIKSWIADQIFNKSSYLAVIGNYTSEKDLKSHKMIEIYQEYLNNFQVVKKSDSEFDFTSKIAICFEKGEYIRLGNSDTEWFPLALLCAIGNGKGEGDYNCPESMKHLVGSWQGYHVVIKDDHEFDLKGFTDLNVVFEE